MRLVQRLLVAQVALDGGRTLHQQLAGVIALDRVDVGLQPERLGVGQAELLVARGVERIAVVQGGDDAVGGGAGRVEHALGQEARAVQGDLALQSGRGVVADELGGAAAGKEAGHGVGLEAAISVSSAWNSTCGNGRPSSLTIVPPALV